MANLSRCMVCMVWMVGLAACSHSSLAPPDTGQPESLDTAIKGLSGFIDRDEATRVAKLLLQATDELAREYDMARPPRFHNLLVHLGLRKRGLCCHWVADLRTKLQVIDSSSVRSDWIVARHGHALLEHNSLVIHAADSTWEQGLVFDPWRTVGQPYWVRVDEDTYSWRQHPLSGNWEQLHCKL